MSRDLRNSRIVIYPNYFNSNISRTEGRRVSIDLSVPNPSIDDIIKVCEKLGLNPEVEYEKTHPKNTLARGRIIVDKRGSKRKTLNAIATELKKLYSKKQ